MAAAIDERWGPPEQDPMLRQGRFMIAGLRLGQVFVGIQRARAPDLSGSQDYASYHDAEAGAAARLPGLLLLAA